MPFRWCLKICKIQINKINQNTAVQVPQNLVQ